MTPPAPPVSSASPPTVEPRSDAATATRPPLRAWRWRPGAFQIVHAVALLAFVAAVKTGADRWGWATLCAYAPRWPWLLPGGLVAGVALLRRRWPWLTVLASLAGGAWLLDAHFVRPLWPPDAPIRLRVMTLNADGGETAGRGTDLARIGRLIAEARPDIVFLQEWREPGPPPLPAGPWNVRRERQQMIVTRLPVQGVAFLPTDRLLGQSSVLACRVDVGAGRPVWLFTPHLETPRGGFNRVLKREPGGYASVAAQAVRRQTVSADAAAWAVDLAGDADVLIGGDFNLIADGRIFRSTWAARFTDAFAAAGLGTGGTKLQDGWRPRIDHLLTGRAWRTTRCWVGPDVGSDHLPLLADVQTR